MPLSRRQFLATTAAPLLQAPRRNLVLIVIDGQRAEMMGCAGNPILQTPNIDQLAARGVHFSQHYCVHGVCMPNRASLFTGRYPAAHGVSANGVALPKSEQTLAHILDAAGYATASAGKHHFEPMRAAGYPPRLNAGASYYGFREVHLTENVPGEEYKAYVRRRFPTLTDADLRRPGLPEEATEIHWITGQTIDFLRRQSSASRPFFAYCSFKDLTPPDTPPASFASLYKPADIPPPVRRRGELDRKPPHYRQVYENQLKSGRYPNEETLPRLLAHYYGQMSFIDKQIGRITAALADAGLAPNTLIALTADHGLCLGDHWIWRHGPWLYDQVLRVPFILYDPALPSPRVVHHLTQTVDIAPTLLDLLGLPPQPGMQGASLRPVAAGAASTPPRDFIYAEDIEADELKASGLDPAGFEVFAIRTSEWKYVHYARQPHGELYDLRNDPNEFDNLWHDPARRPVRDEYRRRLLEALIAQRDPLPPRTASW